MSMESALNALNAVSSAPLGVATNPTNMSNNGANEAVNPPTQETKVNEIIGNNPIEATKTDSAVEEAKADAAAPSPKKDDASSKFAALAKKEKALVKQQADIKAKEQSFIQKEQDIAAREAKIKASEALWETDVLAALESKGYSYQKLTDMILSGKVSPEKAPIDPITEAKKIADDLRKEFSDKEAAREAAIQKSQEDKKAQEAKELEEAYTNYRNSVAEFTKTNADDYELLNMYGQQELVVETVDGYYEKYKRVLSLKEASDLVENYLIDEAQKALGSKKLSKSSPIADKVIAQDEKKSSPRTLSNNLTPTMASTLPASTDSERMKKALAALETAQQRRR